MEGFDEEHLRVLELIDNLSNSVLEDDEMLKCREDILQKLAQLNSTVECVAVEVDAGDPLVSTSLEEIEFARQKIELGYRRFRNAQVVASHSQTEQWLKRRGELLRPAARGSTAPEEVEQAKKPALNDFNPAVSKSEDITATLRRVHQMAQGEVLKGELNIEELDSSTKALRDLENKYSAVDVLLNGSRRLVQVLEEADKGDRRRIQFSLGFLAVVLAWIVYRRVLKLPLKILFWNIVNLTRLGKWAAGLARKTGIQKDELAFETIAAQDLNALDLDPNSIDLAFGREPLETYEPVQTTIEEVEPVHTELPEPDLPSHEFEPEVPSLENPEVFSPIEEFEAEVTVPSDESEPEAPVQSEEFEPEVPSDESEPEPPIPSEESDQVPPNEAFEPVDTEPDFENIAVESEELFNAVLDAETPAEAVQSEADLHEPSEPESEPDSMKTHYYAHEQVVPEETEMPTTGTIYYAPEDTLIKKEL